MAGTEPLHLNIGFSYRFLALQLGVAALGAVAILSTPAGLVWKSALLLVLLVTAAAVHVNSMKAGRQGSIRLIPDGRGFLRVDHGPERPFAVGPNAWATRWLCVLPVFEQDRGRQYHCVICASKNDVDQFRRLLGYLRMRVTAASAVKAVR